jgi:hypothetical protein
MINNALAPVTADGTVAGLGLWEITLSQSNECNSDHAAKWETSTMMHFYPDLVDLAALGTGPLAPGMQPPDGIDGLDPRKHASAGVGQRSAELSAEALGSKARELLHSLPKGNEPQRPPSIKPGEWWMI